MNKKRVIICIAIVLCTNIKSFSQAEETQQLILNVEKLAQLKEILTGLYNSYEVLHSGYTAIKNVSEGNFSLHQQFLDKLQQVSPLVRKYKKVGDIVRYQITILKEYKLAYNRFKSDRNFGASELRYLSAVYRNLFDQSLKNIDALLTVLTASKLRMSDDERLERIDRLFDDMQDKLSFLRHFNKNTNLLAIQRVKEKNDIIAMQNIYGIKY